MDIKASLPKPGLLSSPPESTVKLVLVEDARIEPKDIEVKDIFILIITFKPVYRIRNTVYQFKTQDSI